jgi:hypothetical protein
MKIYLKEVMKDKKNLNLKKHRRIKHKIYKNY